MRVKIELQITPVIGATDPPPIRISIRIGRRVLAEIETSPENIALALTGRLVHAELTKGEINV